MESLQSATPLSIPLARNGQNFAPSKPIIEAIRTKRLSKQESTFQKAIRELYLDRLKYEESAWNELISMGQLVKLFMRGDQLLRRKPYGVGYYVQPVAGDDTYKQTAMNLMGFYGQCCVSKMLAANPNVTIRPGDDTPQAIATAQAARPYVDYHESEFYTAKFNWREALHALGDGIFIHRVRWNPFKGEATIQPHNVNQQSVQLDNGIGECAECDFQSEATDFPETPFGHQCPECQSAAVDVRKPQPQSLAQISLGKPQQVGEPEIITCPFPAWRWDLSKDLEESSWAIYRQRITNGAIQLMLGDAIIPDSSSSEDRGLDVLHALAYAGQAFAGSSGVQRDRQNDKRPTMAEFWISPEDYAGIPIEEGETVCGQTLPKGKLNDFFHDPICVIGLNDMSLVVGTYVKESHRDEVVTGQWFMESDSGAGRGLQDTAAVQKRFNAVDGQILQGLSATATPAIVTDTRILKEEQQGYLFKPGTVLDVNLSMLPPNLGLKDAFHLGTPGNVNQQYIQYGSTFLRDMFQLSALVTEFTQGLVGVDNRTATGAQITAALANSLFGPMLLVKGQSRVRISKILVCLEAKHGRASRFFPGKGQSRGRYVSGTDLQGRVIYELTQNSQLPTTPFSQQTDIRVLIEAMGGIEGLLMLKKTDPAMFRNFVAPFNVKIESQDSDVVSTLCLERLEQMEQNLRSGVNDPQMLIDSLNPPVSMVEPKHAEKQEWWSVWMDLPDSQKSPLILRQAAEAMYWLHMNFQTQKAMPEATNRGMVVGVEQAAAMAPAALGQQALEQQQPEPQVEDKSLEIESKMVMDEAKHKTDLELKHIEGETQRDVAHIQGENAEKTTKLAGENAVKVAHARPKPTKAT